MAEEHVQNHLQDFIAQFSGLKIGDGSSGQFKKEKDKTPAGGVPDEEETLAYFAVALPEGAQSEGSLVFDNLKEALLSMKSHKLGRLKGFSTKEEALMFSTTPLACVTTLSVKDSTLQSVTPQLLVQLRKTIERGDDETFLRNAFNNPKLLVRASDIPSVLQEGTHLNALHIAAKCDKPIICQLVLEMLQNKLFLEKLYPDESSKAIEKRKIQLLDLYLNTPEKTLGETPLHFASKFGSPGCVSILFAHPLCITDRKNVSGKTAEEIMCDRVKPGNMGKTKDALEAAFKNVYYVTISRSWGDNLLSPPVINVPSLIRNLVFDNREEREPSLSQDLFKTSLKIKAFAGPMTLEKAMSFYQTLKYPSWTSCYEKSDHKLLQQIRKSDGNKGVERVARKLAEDLNTDFMEYHAFLNVFANFSKDDGLQVLELFFESRWNQSGNQNLNSVSNMTEGPMKLFRVLPQAHVNALGHSINVYLKENEYAVIPTSSESENYITPPSSPESEREYFSASDSLSETSSHSPYESNRYKDLFIEGFKITKEDVDSLLCLQGRDVDEERFPCVYRWKKSVENKLKKYQGDLQKMKTLTPMASVAVPRLARLPQMDTQIPGSNSELKVRKKLF